MMKTRFFSLMAAALATGFVACNSGDNSSAANDSTENNSSNATTATTSPASTNNYAAMADSFETNSVAGNYLDPRTGKPIRISVDPQTGKATNTETGEAVTRYVDKRTWWVYGGSENNGQWSSQGEAKMNGDRLVYRTDNDKWVGYEERWKTETEKDGDFKAKSENLKIKTEKDGDLKIKTEDDKKIKVDEDGVKVDEDK